MNSIYSMILTGLGATVVMDLWGILRKPLLGIPRPDYRLVGRWFAHMTQGHFRHVAISAAAAMRGERLIGWSAHYLTGIAFSAALVALDGPAWFENPTLAPAVAVGLLTTIAPFLIMQPGMGAGIAASHAPRPWNARFQTVMTHAIFGIGLYVTASVLRLFMP